MGLDKRSQSKWSFSPMSGHVTPELGTLPNLHSIQGNSQSLRLGWLRPQRTLAIIWRHFWLLPCGVRRSDATGIWRVETRDAAILHGSGQPSRQRMAGPKCRQCQGRGPCLSGPGGLPSHASFVSLRPRHMWLHSSLTPLWPHWTPGCFLNMPRCVLPQGLCTCHFLCPGICTAPPSPS